MQKIDGGIFKIIRHSSRGTGKSIVLFTAFLFLILMATGADAFVCTDCHVGSSNPHGSSCSTTNCAGCHAGKAVLHPTGNGTPSGCAACHTTTPHPKVGAGTSLTAACVTSACHGTDGAAHLFTATQLAPYAAIHTGLSVPSTSCIVCHGAGGIVPSEHVTPTATCTICHTTRPGVPSTMVLAHPDAPESPSTACSTCHTMGVKPTEVTACATSTCHGPGGTAHLRNDLDTLRALAVEMHVPADIPRALECIGCHDGVFQKPFAHPEGGAACSTCHPRAGVSPTDVETCKACHDTGPAHKFSETTLATWAHDLHQFGAVTLTTDCTACHPGVIIANMNHPVTPETPDTCADCHARGGVIPDVQTACASCHDGTPGPVFSTSALQTYAGDMHNLRPHANFNTNVNYSASYTLDFNASASRCPTGAACAYSWDFDNNGAADAAGMTATHTFAGAGPYPVTLTVTTNANTNASVTKSVTPVAINAEPIVCSTDWNYNNLTVTFDDCSTDDGSVSVYVNWGDGKPVQTFTLSAQDITHLYAVSGTYNVQHWVQDSAGLSDSEAINVVVPIKRKVVVIALGDGTGEALNAPLASALVRVYKAGVLKAQGYTNSAGTFTSAQVVEPGSVTITISKTGKTIDCDAVTGGAQSVNVPVTNITTTTDGTVACTY